jgi:hypothetical protein
LCLLKTSHVSCVDFTNSNNSNTQTPNQIATKSSFIRD